MNKGDLMRRRILETAEKMFFERGYTATSIQNLLDELKLSKGGFYHHFASKEAILEEICAEKLNSRLERLSRELQDGRLQPIDRVNLLLNGLRLVVWQDAPFAAMLLSTCYGSADAHVREQLRSILQERILPALDAALADGIRSGEFYTRFPGTIARMVEHIAADADDEANRALIEHADNPECVLEAMDWYSAAEGAVETLILAPFGSVSMHDAPSMAEGWQKYRAEAGAAEEEQA